MAPKPLTVKEYLDGLPIAGLLALLVVIGSRLGDLLVDIGSALQMCDERVLYLLSVLEDLETLQFSKKHKRDWIEVSPDHVVILDEEPVTPSEYPNPRDYFMIVETIDKKIDEVEKRRAEIEKISREISAKLWAINRLHDEHYLLC
jgi:hypothetical protein